MPHLAIVTCAAHPTLYAEEHDLLTHLRAHGADVQPVVWSDAGVDWRAYDRVVLRSTWDYFEREPEFRAWLAVLAAQAVDLVNAHAIVTWNLDKRYLADLAARGVAIVPTHFVARGEAFDLAGALAMHGWDDAVVKPAVSGGAYRTHRVHRDEARARQPEIDATLASSGLLVQPFLRAITSEGEWSLVFFDGVFSHAVLKKPAAGEYRIQTQFGGTFARVDPPRAILDEARAAIAAMPATPHYARIDGVVEDGRFLLMELEAIEPYLYFAAAPDAIARYVAAITRGLA